MTLVVKLGSSIVAADDGSLRSDVLDSVAAQVAQIRERGIPVVMVTSGAIARGMRMLGLRSRPTAMDELQAASAIGQGSLFSAYEQRLGNHRIATAQVLLTASDLSERAHYVNARQTISRLLEWGVVPVVNENDTTATDEITFGDNDFLAAQLAVLIKARLLVLLTNTDGLYTANPNFHADARLIEEVGDISQLEELEIGQDTSLFGTGGMGSKVAAAEIASQSGVETVICNGTRDGTLVGALSDSPLGTRFSPHQGHIPAFKLWLRYAKPVAGTIYVDQGAADSLLDRGASLLAVGIDDLTGTFNAGDAVAVASSDGRRLVGKGISNFSSKELARISGLQSTKVRELFEHAADEVIHRDRFVLF